MVEIEESRFNRGGVGVGLGVARDCFRRVMLCLDPVSEIVDAELDRTDNILRLSVDTPDTTDGVASGILRDEISLTCVLRPRVYSMNQYRFKRRECMIGDMHPEPNGIS